MFRGQWLIDRRWTQDNLPIVLKMLKGEAVDFGVEKNVQKEPSVLSHKSGSAYSVNYYTDLSKIPDNSIAVLTIAGPILKYGDYCSYGSVHHAATINRLANAGNISAIIINADTPGGQAAGTASLADTIKQTAAEKPVIGLVDDGMACSAGVWILSACSEIYVTQKTDIIGSVGVYTTIMDWYAYFESEGLKARDIYAPQSTDKNLDYRNALENNDDLLKEELRVLCQQFIETVSNNRSGKLTSDDWQTGKLYYAKEAQKIGLIDGIKSFSQVIDRANTLSKSFLNNNSNSKTNYSMKFPKIASFFGIKNDEENKADISLETHGETLEALFAERDSLITEKAELNNTIASLQESIVEKDATNNTLAENNAKLIEEKTTLQNKIIELEALDGGKLTDTSEEKDKNPASTAPDPMAFGFQQEILNRI